MQLRLATAADAAVWIQLNREFMNFEIKDAELWSDAGTAGDEAMAEIFRQALDRPGMITIFMLEEGNQTIGFTNLMSIFSVWAHGLALVIDDLYIRPEFRGAGLGRQAMSMLESYAAESGYKRIQFQSEETNPGAKAFYKAVGYHPGNMSFYVKYL